MSNSSSSNYMKIYQEKNTWQKLKDFFRKKEISGPQGPRGFSFSQEKYKIKYTSDYGYELTKAKPNDACFDICSGVEVEIIPKKRTLIPTGIKLELPYNIEAQVRSRSGLSLKKGLVVLNSPGTVDPDYRGDVGVILYNVSEEKITIKPGERIAQIKFSFIPNVEIELTDQINSFTQRGDTGFGSSGT